MDKSHNIKAFFALAALVLLAGCTSVAPIASSTFSSRSQVPAEAHSQTVVSLSEGNFVMVKTNVVGMSKGFNLLGFIPIYPARLTKAMNRLYTAADIEEGTAKTPANLLIEYTSTYWIIFSIPETIVRADVVQFKTQSNPITHPSISQSAPP